MGKIVFNRRDLAGSTPQKSAIMKELMQDPKVRTVLNQSREQRQFLKELRKYGKEDHNLTVNEIEAALAELKYGQEDALSRGEVNRLSRALHKKLGISRTVGHSDLARDSKLRDQASGIGDSQVSSKKPHVRRAHPLF